MVKVQLRAGGVRSDDDVVCFLRARPDSGVSAGLRLFPVSSRFLRSLWLVTHLDKQYYCMPGIGYQYSAIISIIRRYIHELVYFEVLNISSWIPRTWYSYCIVEFSEFSTDYKNFSCEFDRQSGWYLWSIHPSLHPSIPPSIHPSIHPSTHPSMCILFFVWSCGHCSCCCLPFCSYEQK